MNKILHSFQDNTTEEIGFKVKQHKGVDLVDIRTYRRTPGGVLKPTTKELTLKVGSLSGLREGIEKLGKR